jgi:hypothetical protein
LRKSRASWPLTLTTPRSGRNAAFMYNSLKSPVGVSLPVSWGNAGAGYHMAT